MRGVLVVTVDMELGIVPVGRVVVAVYEVPVDAGPNIVPFDREVDDSHWPPSSMADLCPALKLLVA